MKTKENFKTIAFVAGLLLSLPAIIGIYLLIVL